MDGADATAVSLELKLMKDALLLDLIINDTKSEEDDGAGSEGDSERWQLKPNLRGKGSLHHDRWTGTAARRVRGPSVYVSSSNAALAVPIGRNIRWGQVSALTVTKSYFA